MKSNELFEMPLRYQVDDNFDEKRKLMHLDRQKANRNEIEHWKDRDLRAIKNNKYVNAFKNSPYNINVFITHLPEADYDKFLTKGLTELSWIEKHFDTDAFNEIKGWYDPNSINVILTNNLADDNRISLTSWMLAHRIGHALFGYYSEIANEFKKFVMKISSYAYNIEWKDPNTGFGRMVNDENMEYLGVVFGSIFGTMNSAKKNMINRFSEWFYETFSQYLITGKININNSLPEEIYGYPLTTDKKKLWKAQQYIELFAEHIGNIIDTTLKANTGKIFVG
jgi:hypothetical protein